MFDVVIYLLWYICISLIQEFLILYFNYDMA